MNQAPVFTLVHEAIEVKEHEAVQVPVKAEGKPCPQLAWYKDGKLIQENNGLAITHSQDGQEVSGTLALSDVQMEDEAKYSVKASNKAGTAKTEIPLTGELLQKLINFIS